MTLRPASRGPWRALCFLSWILVLDPVGAWYKHVASPRYHTVGRASGLLMGVSRSPYLWRRRASEEEPRPGSDAAPSLPALWAPSPWLEVQHYSVEGEPWTAPEQPQPASQGPPGKGRAGKRGFLQQATPSPRAGRKLRGGLAWPSRCPAGCHETPRGRPLLYPGLVGRAAREKVRPGTTQEARVF